MGIIIRKYKGGYRPWWYANRKEGGKLKEFRLDVPIEGTPPASLSVKDCGDAKFEKSRIRAQIRLETILKECQRKGAAEEIMKDLIKSQTGETVVFVRLDELAERWNGIARTKDITEGRKQENTFIFKEFADSCGKKQLIEVTDRDVAIYFASIKAKFAWSTVKSRMSLLSGAFSRFLPTGRQNPFKSIMKRDTSEGAGIIHHAPLSNEQLEKVRAVARKDEFIYPLVECAICTGMRLKDICFLRWTNVDLVEGFITFVTAKTSTRCDVPLFPELRAVCEKLYAKRDRNEPYVFPEAANMYTHNRSGLVYRGKKLMAEALFDGKPEKDEVIDIVDGEPVPPKTPAEILAIIDRQDFLAGKKERMKAIYTCYAVKKQSYRQIETETKLARSTISNLLKDLEKLVGEKIIRFDPTEATIRDRVKLTREERSGGKRSVCVYGWHSFRATFCILALHSGIPESLIIKAVGHATFKTTKEFYNEPTRAIIREYMKKKMSDTAIGEKHLSLDDQMATLRIAS